MNLLKSLTNLFKKEEPEKSEETLPAIKETSEIKEHKPGPHTKFSEEEQHILIDLIAQGLTHSQVSERLYEITGKRVSYPLLYQYQNTKKWKPMLKELRDKYFSDISKLDASHKYARIKRMDYVQEKAIKKGDLKTAVSANEQIRREFEREASGEVNIYHNNPVYQQFNSLSNDELIRRYDEATKRLKEKSSGPDRSSEES